MPDLVPVRRALISVSDKAGVEAFARALIEMGVQIISTGGTAKLLRERGLAVTPIDAVTGFPEMMDGRVKTLHPKVHGGLLALRDDPEHAAAMRDHAIEPIDLLCINLYPFEATITKPGVTRDEAIEQIDIGGPAMVRSGSKNHGYVAVVTEPAQYEGVLAEMRTSGGCTSLATRAHLAQRAYMSTARYDAAIAVYLGGPGALEPAPAPPPVISPGEHPATPAAFPDTITLRYAKLGDLRYGENPHQRAAVYVDPAYAGPSVISAQQLHGKELSYNNLHDAAAALELALALRAAAPAGAFAACCIKHANPCGAAIAATPRDAVDRTIAGDPLAAFGGIMAATGVLDARAADRLTQKDIFLEVLVVEAIHPDALAALRARWQNLRILETGPLADVPPIGMTTKAIRGGALAQDADERPPNPAEWALRAGPAPSEVTIRAAAALEIMVRAMNSNAIAIGSANPDGVALLGAGLGQVDRVTACGLAVTKAGPRAQGAIAVSDAFFPFPDGPQALIAAGVKTIVHPGGSKRDDETFALCERSGVTCLTTGVRRFRH